jgi:hypothetical protein
VKRRPAAGVAGIPTGFPSRGRIRGGCVGGVGDTAAGVELVFDTSPVSVGVVSGSAPPPLP